MDGAPKKGNLRDRHSPPSFSAYFRFDNELRTFKNIRLRAADIIPELYTSNNARKTIYISYVGRALTNEVCCLSVSLPNHSPVSCSTPPLACLLLSFITRLTSHFPLALLHHSPASCSSPSLTCYLALALFYHLPVSCCNVRMCVPHCELRLRTESRYCACREKYLQKILADSHEKCELSMRHTL